MNHAEMSAAGIGNAITNRLMQQAQAADMSAADHADAGAVIHLDGGAVLTLGRNDANIELAPAAPVVSGHATGSSAPDLEVLRPAGDDQPLPPAAAAAFLEIENLVERKIDALALTLEQIEANVAALYAMVARVLASRG